MTNPKSSPRKGKVEYGRIEVKPLFADSFELWWYVKWRGMMHISNYPMEEVR